MYTVYMVRTSRGNLYTGISKDVHKRVFLHNSGKGSKCLRGQLPVKLVWESPTMSRSEALRVEHGIKVIGRQNKQDIIEGRLVLYRTGSKAWSFALCEVLEIIPNGCDWL